MFVYDGYLFLCCLVYATIAKEEVAVEVTTVVLPNKKSRFRVIVSSSSATKAVVVVVAIAIAIAIVVAAAAAAAAATIIDGRF